MAAIVAARDVSFDGTHPRSERELSATGPESSEYWRRNVALTTFDIELPAARRMASTLRRLCRVCSWMVAPTTAPVTGLNGPWPETKRSPAALTA
jgi:hypothetical protein